MTKIAIKLVGLIISLSATVANATAPINMLGRVTVEASPKLSIITVRLKTKPVATNFKIENHGSFFQVKIPNTIAPEPGTFVNGAGPFVKKVAVLQPTESETIIRIFTDKQATNFAQATSIEVLDKRILITTDHAIAGDTPVLSHINPIKQKARESLQLGMKKDNFYDSLMTASMYLGFLFMLLAAVLWYKPLRKNRGSKKKNKQEIAALRTLSTLALSPKQKLSLIQVGDEQILIGITPDSISMITKVETNKPEPQQISNIEATATLKEIRGARQNILPPKTLTSTGFAKSLEDPKPIAPTIAKKPSVKISPVDKLLSGEGASYARTAPKKAEPKSAPKTESIDNITKLIREKLSNLPSV